jgi:hypothetical protein
LFLLWEKFKSSQTASEKRNNQYRNKDKKRLNNPPVSLADAHTDNGNTSLIAQQVKM